MARRETRVETYGMEHDLGPAMEVEEARGGKGYARFSMEVGWWGIICTLEPAETKRLRDQLTEILGDG